MMKTMLRVLLFPVMMTIRIMLGLMAFMSAIASSIIGLSASFFAVLSVVEFAIGDWQNGIAFAVLTLLVSPIGIPGIANLVLGILDRAIGFFEQLLAS